jgi:hypothetical protein
MQNPEYAQAMINHMNAQAEHQRAEAEAADPKKQVGALDEIMRDPARSRAFLLMKGVDPSSINSIPTPPVPGAVTQQNVQQHMSQPQNSALSQVLNDENLSLDDKLFKAEPFLAQEARSGISHQIVNEHLKSLFATNPDDWQQQYYSPPKPIGNPVADFATSLGAKLINTPLNYLFGAGNPYGTQTGLFNQQKAYETAQRRIGLLLKHNLSPK